MLILSDDVVIINESDSCLTCMVFSHYLVWKFSTIFVHHDSKIRHSKSMQFFLSQSVENVVNTRSCMKKINTVIYRETGVILKNTII